MRVSVDDDVAEAGLKLAVTPDGSPLVPNVTDPPKPPLGLTETEYVVPAPAVTVWEAGVTPSEKSGAGADPPEKAPRPFGEPRPVGPS